MTSPRLDQDACLGKAVEDFAVEAFVAQRPVERFIVAALPWRPWRDIERRDAHLGEAFQAGFVDDPRIKSGAGWMRNLRPSCVRPSTKS